MTHGPSNFTIVYSTTGAATTGGNVGPTTGLNLNAPAGGTTHHRGKRPGHLRLVR